MQPSLKRFWLLLALLDRFFDIWVAKKYQKEKAV